MKSYTHYLEEIFIGKSIERIIKLENKSIVFLTYINRSGSTFLANLLSKYSDVGVSLEARLPDGIVRRPFNIKANGDIEKFLKKLYLDPKFSAWNINRERLKEDLLRSKKPIKYDKILPILLRNYFKHNERINIYIYKCGQYIKNIESVRNIFPESKIIFVLRDGRAIYNSQKKSLDSRTNKPMARNPINVANKYNNILKRVEKYGPKDWFYLLKYEDLVKETSKTITNLITYLGGKGKFIEDLNYNLNIPNSQKHLHRNIKKEPLEERINGWKNELEKEEIKIFEKIAAKTLKKFGYDLYSYPDLEKRYWKLYLKFEVNHILDRFGDKIKLFSSVYYLLDRIWYRLNLIKNLIKKDENENL